MPIADQARSGEPTIRVSQSYRTSIEAVFDAWTKPELLEQWFGPPGYRAELLQHDLRPGGAWRFLMHGPNGQGFHHFGAFVEIRAPHRLAFTWASKEPFEGWRDGNGALTLVTVEFEQQADRVLVTITHEQLQNEELRQALVGGWGGSLAALGDYLDTTENQ